MTIENKHDAQVNLTKIVDEFPPGFSYVTNSSSLKNATGTVISTDDPSISGQELTWTPPAATKLQVGGSATLTFTGTAASTAGVYCNEVYAEKGGKKTRSGKTAKVTIGSPSDTACKGTAITLTKTVTPEVVFGDTATTYTYVISIVNEGSDTLQIREIKDYISDQMTYVTASVSSTPLSLDPGAPQTKAAAGNSTELKWKANKNSLYELLPGTTWLLEFKTTGTLPRGFYVNDTWLRLDKSNITVFPTSVATGTPDTYTYAVTIDNDGTETLTVEKVTASIDKNVYTFVNGSSTSTPKTISYDTVSVTAGGATIDWLNSGGEQVLLAAGETWVLEFKLTSTSADPAAQNPQTITLDLTETGTTDRPVDRTTGPTAAVTVVDVYRITIETPDGIFVCDVWLASDVDTGDFSVVEGCVL